MILQEAVGQGASDIHIEPQATDVVVRFRVDGQLRDVMTVPRSPDQPGEPAEDHGRPRHRRAAPPQDGRARFVRIGAQQVDIRMSTLPALPGESIVMRLLPAGQRPAAARQRSACVEDPARVSAGTPCASRRVWSSSPDRPVRVRRARSTARCWPSAAATSTSSRWRTRSRSRLAGIDPGAGVRRRPG